MRRAVLALLLAGCSRPSQSAAPDPRSLYELRCAPCHGSSGRGDGPSTSWLSKPPRDLTSTAWQASVDDAHLRKVIVNGGLGVGLSKEMPGSPDLAARPAELDALIQHVRSLAARLPPAPPRPRCQRSQPQQPRRPASPSGPPLARYPAGQPGPQDRLLIEPRRAGCPCRARAAGSGRAALSGSSGDAAPRCALARRAAHPCASAAGRASRAGLARRAALAAGPGRAALAGLSGASGPCAALTRRAGLPGASG